VRLCVAEVVVAVVTGAVVAVAGAVVTEDAAVTEVAGEISSGHRGILRLQYSCVFAVQFALVTVILRLQLRTVILHYIALQYSYIALLQLRYSIVILRYIVFAVQLRLQLRTVTV
jgi:hypothetical protein